MIDPEWFHTASVQLPKVAIRFCHDGAAREVLEACHSLGLERLLLISTNNGERRYSRLWQALEPLTRERFFAAQPHCPIEVVEACRRSYQNHQCDAVIVVGGGSAIGLGKILAVEENAKFIALPTTYSGSEMTSIFGRKLGQQKKTAVNEACRPDIVIYDSALSTGLAKQVSVSSAMNSIAHAAEALYPKTPNPIAAALAKECLRSHKLGLTALASNDDEPSARSWLLYGGCLGGLVIGMTGIAIHHQLCHLIGGLYDLAHGESNSAVLPQVLAYNRDYAAHADRVIADIFEGANAAQAVFDFADRLDAPLSLQQLGMPPQGVEQVVTAMLSHGGYNPRPIEEVPLRRAIQNAFDGARPD